MIDCQLRRAKALERKRRRKEERNQREKDCNLQLAASGSRQIQIWQAAPANVQFAESGAAQLST